ncbi:uncharacterized protein LOC144158541 isoform X11 [Haemaphysalis longicornis]
MQLTTGMCPAAVKEHRPPLPLVPWVCSVLSCASTARAPKQKRNLQKVVLSAIKGVRDAAFLKRATDELICDAGPRIRYPATKHRWRSPRQPSDSCHLRVSCPHPLLVAGPDAVFERLVDAFV